MKKQTNHVKEHQEKNFNIKSKRLVNDTDINQRVYKWYCQKRARNFCVTGPMLQEIARNVARHLMQNDDFKAANGWLTRFKMRYAIGSNMLHGESRSMDAGIIRNISSFIIELFS